MCVFISDNHTNEINNWSTTNDKRWEVHVEPSTRWHAYNSLSGRKSALYLRFVLRLRFTHC
jgi:hypothetical protein